MMKSNSVIVCLVIFLSFFTTIYSQQSQSCQALLTDIQGKVLIKKSQRSEFATAVWGSQLYHGDQVRTLEGSSASLLFMNQSLITLGANSTITISNNQINGGQNKHNSMDLAAELPKDLSLLSFRQTENGEVGALAGLRSTGSEDITLITPRNSKLSTLTPYFKWQPITDFDNYQITLFDDRGKIWSKDVNTPVYDLKTTDQALEYGKSYFWFIVGQGLFENKRSESIGFSIPSEGEYNAIHMRKEHLLKMFKNNANSNSYLFVLGSSYEKEGFYLDAIETFKRISEMNPDAPLPHQILGNLYQKVGLKDMAIVELQNAVKLSNEVE